MRTTDAAARTSIPFCICGTFAKCPRVFEAACFNSLSSDISEFHELSEIISDSSEFIDGAIASGNRFATVAFFPRETRARGFSRPH